LHHVHISKSTGVPDNPVRRSLQVYPNPSSGVFFIRSADAMTGLVVHDMTGRIIRESGSPDDPLRASLNPALPPGLYFLQVNYQDGFSQSLKILKQ
jgi:hypothetical protein